MNDKNNFVGQSDVWGDENEVVFDVPFPLMKTSSDVVDQIQEEEEEDEVTMRQKMWVEKQQSADDNNNNDNCHLVDLSQASSYYVDDFSPLPAAAAGPPDHFTCMSSSSSSPSSSFAPPPPPPPPLVYKTVSESSSSTSSNAGWPPIMTKSSDLERLQMVHHVPSDAANGTWTSTSLDAAISLSPQDSSTRGNNIDCLNHVMEDFDFMDVMDQIDIWDSSSPIFQGDHRDQVHQVVAAQVSNQQHHQIMQPLVIPEEEEAEESSSGGLSYFLQGNSELSALFLEWLIQNKDRISSDDLKNIKLKRSTIETASKRLGNNDEGNKQLFKLILQWVEHNLLHKKRTNRPPPPPDPSPPYLSQNPNSYSGLSATNLYCNSLPPLDFDANNCFTTSTWIQPPAPYANYQSAYQTPAPYPIPATGYVYDPYSNKIVDGNNFVPLYPQMDSSETWSGQKAAPQVNSFWGSINNVAMAMAVPNPLELQLVNGNSSNGYQVFDENGERLVKLGPIATKEARKKRMARHKRLGGVHHHHNYKHQNQVYENQQQMACADEKYSKATPNFVYNWPQTQPTENHPADPPQGNMKKENNLQFLLQKVLKQSDVGNLGRIVLPKKEAELHLPELKSSNGIQITIQDIATSNVWTMRYRFWPNNNSRMYLFENTGQFVRANGLQEGDFIVLYSDTKSGKYLIRGIKVRPSETTRPAVVNKKATKKSRNTHRSTSEKF